MIKEFRNSLEQMNASFKLDAKSVKNSTMNLEKVLSKLKEKPLQELNQVDHLDNTMKLLEKLSIINEFKLNLFKDFSLYHIQKK